jgi:hypothetical protein
LAAYWVRPLPGRAGQGVADGVDRAAMASEVTTRRSPVRPRRPDSGRRLSPATCPAGVTGRPNLPIALGPYPSARSACTLTVQPPLADLQHRRVDPTNVL